MEPVETHNSRLFIRQVRSRDVEDALVYRDGAEFSRYLQHIPRPFTRRHAEASGARNRVEPWDRSATFREALTGTVIGTVNLDVDQTHGMAMLGSAIGHAQGGKRSGWEAAPAAVGWGLGAFDLANLWGTTDVRNGRGRQAARRSQRLIEKLASRRAATFLPRLARDGRPDKLDHGSPRPSASQYLNAWVAQGAAA
ncbi:MAG: GNAT family N-acetyltransferase [Hyphomicrobiaceae bacterium]|nr:GNAT family N-acetyltransferase [Hyphomicrobiaceae bacterium]